MTSQITESGTRISSVNQREPNTGGASWLQDSVEFEAKYGTGINGNTQLASISEIYQPEGHLSGTVLLLYGKPVEKVIHLQTAQGPIDLVEVLGERSGVPYQLEAPSDIPNFPSEFMSGDLGALALLAVHEYLKFSQPVAELYLGNGTSFRLVRVEEKIPGREPGKFEYPIRYELRPIEFWNTPVIPKSGTYEYYKAVFSNHDLMLGLPGFKLMTPALFYKRFTEISHRSETIRPEGDREPEVIDYPFYPLSHKNCVQIVNTLTRIIERDENPRIFANS